MFDLEEYYKLYNSAALRLYAEQKQQIRALTEGKTAKGVRENAARYVKEQADFLNMLIQWEEKATREYYLSASLSELKETQDKLYAMQEEQYARSALCPSHMAKIFGGELGPVLSAVAYQLQENIRYASRHMRFAMTWNQELFLKVAEILLRPGKARAEEIVACICECQKAHVAERSGLFVHQNYIPDPCMGEDWIREADLSDPGVLYALGVRVTEEDLAYARFMQGASETDIEKMARSIVDGYRRGFFVDGKDIVAKKTVGLFHRLGMERVTKRIMELFESEIRFIPFISRIYSTRKNQQCEYDHRFDIALVLDQGYVDAAGEALRKTLEENRQILSVYGGPAFLGSFGEEPFEPKNRKESIAFRPEQSELYSQYMDQRMQLLEEYIPGSGTSFTMAAYPAPQIGSDFEAIFREMLTINTLDNDKYLKVQQHIIDALDQGCEAEILGHDGNETDLRIALAPIQDPKHQTNFYNCVADVNIPLGEVFTSPQLNGTNGLLHVDSFYNDGIRYKDLKLTFENGYVTDYSCGNFEDPEENKRLIRENLLFPHETLPLGEFAIGTNTLAYKMAKQYNIVEKLPILIVEKMGPHFAIGDTCYVGTEEIAVYNPQNGKEVVARENERTALRNEDRSKAYTHKHTDITLPYHGIGVIRVKTAAGQQIEIIRNGRFVLRGTELLNEALKELEEQHEGKDL